MGHRLWYPRGQSLAILQSELAFADKPVGGMGLDPKLSS
jgi:hypothetical protein